jgi:murein DD-endopeptidase MepM/ murein hydrolase activator NlpD
LHVRGRLAFGRSSILAVIVAALALVFGGTGTILATGSTPPAPAERPEPRIQHPGEATGFRLPFEPGIDVPIHQGWNTLFSHRGRAAFAYDFGLPEGTPVLAAASGVVSWAHGGESACGGAGLLLNANYVTIDHPDGSATQYGHLSAVDVRVGDVVAAGQQIGRSGRTGYSGCLAHLHFARQAQGGPVTQSIPVYFDGYSDRAFVSNEAVTAPAAACSSSDREAPLNAFCATYSARAGEGEAEGVPHFSRLDDAIDFDWAAAAPGGYWLDDPADGFSARWAGRFVANVPGPYEISVLASDRVRVSIDGVRVLNLWNDHRELEDLAARVLLGTGVHRIEVEAEDADGRGMLKVDWGYRFDDAQGWWLTRLGKLL